MRAWVTGMVSALILGGPLAGQDLVLLNANLVDVTDGSIRSGVSVRISDGRVVGVDAGGATAPAGARVVDLAGRYLAPGLIDAHVHVGSEEQARRALMSGVTTMRSAGAAHYADVGMRELQRAGYAQTPEYLAAGYHVRPDPAEALFQDHPDLGRYREGGIRGPDAVRAMARAMMARGLDFLKVNATERAGVPTTDPRKQLYSAEELRALVEEAAAGGIGVMAHAHGDAGGRAAVEAGVRSIEHGTYLSPETLEMMARRGTFLVPTIAIVRDLTVPGGDYDNAFLNVRGRHMLPRVQEMARTAHRLGVRIVAATDTGYGRPRAPRAGGHRDVPAGGAPGRHHDRRGASGGVRPHRADRPGPRGRPRRAGAEPTPGHRRGSGRPHGGERRSRGGPARGLARGQAGLRIATRHATGSPASPRGRLSTLRRSLLPSPRPHVVHVYPRDGSTIWN